MNFKLIANILGAAVILLLVFAYGVDSDYTVDEQEKEPDINTPSGYLINSTTKLFDVTGRLETEIDSNLIEHFEHKDTSVFHQPDIVNYNTDNSKWLVTADTGNVLPGGDEIELSGNAKVRKNTPPLLIESDYLRGKTDASYLETDQAVRITNPESTTTAVGMQANINAETVDLLKNVKTLYRQP